jgi:hypothetical protein
MSISSIFIVPFWKTFGGANGQANGAEFEISSDTQSEDDDSASERADRVKAQSVARVGGNGKWGIHEIIGKEVINNKVHYCVDWDPTMISADELEGAERLVREFEAKEEARFRRAGKGKRKRRAQHRNRM